MREIVFRCDQCKKELSIGEEPTQPSHFHIKTMEIAVATREESGPVGHTIKRWQETPVINNKERQFCSLDCMIAFLRGNLEQINLLG